MGHEPPPTRSPPTFSEDEPQKLTRTIENIDYLKRSQKLFESSKYFILSYCPPEQLTETLSKCRFFAYIYHDKDDKEPHYHYYVTYSMNKNLYNLAKEFRADHYTFMVENVRSRKGCLRYLVHRDDPDKAQYPVGSVISNNFESVERACRDDREPCQDNLEFIKDMYRLTTFEMGCKYGRDFMKNVNAYGHFCQFLVGYFPFDDLSDDQQIADSIDDYNHSFARSFSTGNHYIIYERKEK